MIGEAVRFLREHEDILLIAHVSPDGDTLGSSLALYQMLLQMNKSVQIVCEEPVPAVYGFLPCAQAVGLPHKTRPAEAAVCVDCADIERTGTCRALFDVAAYSLNIDHHATNTHYADSNFVRKAAATAELVFTLIAPLGLTLSKDIASCLFAAVATDTGNFAYSETTPETFRTAAALLEAGIDLPALNRSLFRTVPGRKVKLLGVAIAGLRLYCGGRLGMSALSQADMQSCGATGEDAEGIIDTIRDIDTVEIAVLLRESTDGRIRVSLRGKSDANVGDIALSFGGGGHRLAAGCTLEAPMEEAVDRLRRAAENTLDLAEA